MTDMSKEEIEKFLMQGTFTGKLATTKKDGSSHVVPIWFVFDSNNNDGRVSETEKEEYDDIIFTTSSGSAKARNIQRENRVSICVDDQTPPFSFVTIFGITKIYPYKQKDVLKWATKIAERYGKEQCRSVW